MSTVSDMENVFASVPMKMKQRKAELGLSIDKLAEECGIPPSNVENWFAGKQKKPNAYYLAALAVRLGMSLDELFCIETEDRKIEIAEHELIAESKRWRHLAVLCFALFVFMVVWYIIDLRLPHVGLYRWNA